MKMNKLSAQFVKTAPVGRHYDGGGLHLLVRKNGSKSWVYRFTVPGQDKRQDMGLGSLTTVSLADARKSAHAKRRLVQQGIDPIKHQMMERAANQDKPTFSECVSRFVESHSSEWVEGHRRRWVSSLATHAEPIIGHLPVDEVDTDQILAVLKPIWAEKTDTANRVRQRMERVLDWASTMRYREGGNPCRWRGHVENLLPSPNKTKTVKHRPALPWPKIHRFMKDLRARDGNAAAMLEFQILTGTRPGEARGTVWSEVDLESRVWLIPAERMKKTRREHRVPLSRQAVELLSKLPHDSPNVFPNTKGQELSDMAALALVKRMGYKGECVPHGFRSTMRDWAAEETSFPREVVEQALSHTLSAVEGAYRRGDLFKKRKTLMQVWADYIDTPPGDAKVVPIRKGLANG